jgi:tubulin-specific chaperone A
MKTFTDLTLRTKLIGSFIFVVLVASIISYVSSRLSLRTITEEIIPPLKLMGQTGILATATYAEALEYVSSGEEDAIQDLADLRVELDTLLDASDMALAEDTAEVTGSEGLFVVIRKLSSLSQNVVESHNQTLAHLEELEEAKHEADELFAEARGVVEAEITRNLQDGDLNELRRDSIITQRYLNEFIAGVELLHLEAIEYISFEEEEAIEEFEEAEEHLETAEAELAKLFEPDEPGEAGLVERLDDVEERLEASGQAIFASHNQTIALLEELEGAEDELDEVIAATQRAVDQDIGEQVAQANRNAAVASLAIMILAVSLGVLLTGTIVRPIYQLVQAARQIGAGDFTAQAEVESRDEIGEMAQSFNAMTNNLRHRINAEEQAKLEAEAANQNLEMQIWQTTGQAQLSDRMRGEQDLRTLANSIVQHVCEYLQVQIGALYVVEDRSLTLAGHYAYSSKKPTEHFKFGEGLVGQAAMEKRPLLFRDVPEHYITIRSGLGEAAPKNIMVFPLMYVDQVVGVIELGVLTQFNEMQIEFMDRVLSNIAIAFNTAQARARIDELLVQTQNQAEELQAQSEELRVANEELEAQTESLRASETRLKEQQVELEATNVQLEEKAAALEESGRSLQEKQTTLDTQNQDLKQAQQELKKRADELALASKYKSEFLANMSHELRTPLNSLLILARILAENAEGNLTEEQVQSAEIIHSGGNDLLNLINSILDLSKVEAGKLSFNFEPMSLIDLVKAAQHQFSFMAEEKGLAFSLSLGEDLPDAIVTDHQRVKQIIKNLLSNALKFTHAGSVSLDIQRPQPGVSLYSSGLDPNQAIAISVADTGIGMTPEQQKIVFEAFQQADGSTNRQYGGTGLGLSISRELAIRLGGQIDVESQPNQGSTFTLYLPFEPNPELLQEMSEPETPVQTVLDRDVPDQDTSQPETFEPRIPEQNLLHRDRSEPGIAGLNFSEPEMSEPDGFDQPIPQLETPEPARPEPQLFEEPMIPWLPDPATRQLELVDDRAELDDGDKILLIIEDDPVFARFVHDFSHKQSFKGLIALDGKTGLELVKTYSPDAIILDLNLPDISGWEVLEALKNEPATRHIPVHIISANDEVIDAFRKGAIGYLNKPVNPEGLTGSFQKIEQFIAKEIKSLLLVEDDANARHSIKLLLGGSDVQITEVERGQVALDLLRTQHFDCMILDLSLPDMSGFEVLNRMNGDEPGIRCPVIVYTGRELTVDENLELMKYADSVIVKGAKSPERLLDETALFLHRVVADMPTDKQQTIKQLYHSEDMLKDKRILIVDDDIRNSFALSKLLSEKGLIVKIAQDGQKALDLLARERVDLVLMDIMMPVLDGYETIRRIRSQPELRHLPVLALTAKAMKGDREKCLEAGANDYLSKPIDVDRLFSMLRVWLYQ